MRNNVSNGHRDYSYSMDNLRGQTYDGAANMSGAYRGAQSFIHEKQPLAPFVHCLSHSLNLVAMAALGSHRLTRDALSLVHEIGVFISSSPKMTVQFKDAASGHGDLFIMRPICPTRWLVKSRALQTFINHFDQLSSTFKDLRNDRNIAVNISSTRMSKGDILLGATIALRICEQLEALNASSQGITVTEATELVIKDVRLQRSPGKFQYMLSEVQKQLEKCGMQLPRQHRVTKRFVGPFPDYAPQNVEEFYLPIYYEILDTTVMHLEERVTQKSISQIQTLEETLLTGIVSQTCYQYPELSENYGRDLVNELQMFHRHHPHVSSLCDVVNNLKSMTPECRHLFSSVENWVRLLLVIPASSSTAERSFSGLRRVKTWLRSTMTQQRLNHMAVLHAHQEVLDMLEVHSELGQFITLSDIRKNLFGCL
jgi:hypothetical protein